LVESSSRAEIERELGRGLLDEFSGEHTGPAPADAAATRSGRSWAWLLPALAIPLLAFAIYLNVGEPEAGVLRGAAAILELDPEQDRLELDRWRVRLAERVLRVPDDAQSHHLLGRIYLYDGEYAMAAQSFSRTHAIIGGEPANDGAWLQALILANDGRLDDSGREVANRILQREPNSPMVLEMVAVDAYLRGDYRESVRRFNQALGNAVEPRRSAALGLFLQQARTMLGDLRPSIDVALEVTETPPPSATLFVIARPVGGGMPFAVVRRNAGVLPKAVRLDDAVSMNPALPLSGAGEIEVVVRVSLTGAAAYHPGDWEWRSAPLTMAEAESFDLVAEIASPDGAPPEQGSKRS